MGTVLLNQKRFLGNLVINSEGVISHRKCNNTVTVYGVKESMQTYVLITKTKENIKFWLPDFELEYLFTNSSINSIQHCLKKCLDDAQQTTSITKNPFFETKKFAELQNTELGTNQFWTIINLAPEDIQEQHFFKIALPLIGHTCNILGSILLGAVSFLALALMLKESNSEPDSDVQSSKIYSLGITGSLMRFIINVMLYVYSEASLLLSRAGNIIDVSLKRFCYPDMTTRNLESDSIEDASFISLEEESPNKESFFMLRRYKRDKHKTKLNHCGNGIHYSSIAFVFAIVAIDIALFANTSYQEITGMGEKAHRLSVVDYGEKFYMLLAITMITLAGLSAGIYEISFGFAMLEDITEWTKKRFSIEENSSISSESETDLSSESSSELANSPLINNNAPTKKAGVHSPENTTSIFQKLKSGEDNPNLESENVMRL